MIKNYWWIFLILVVLIILSPFVFRTPKTATIVINNKTFNVEVADNDAERVKGLSGRTSLDANAGMLFVFPRADIWPFWMKDTLIPLDIIWINASTSLSTGKIVEMTTLDIPSGDNIPSYTPIQKAQYVLELNANSGFKVGDEVEIKY